MDDLGPYLLAGRVQAASGQRVVEGRIKKAEEEQKDSVRYWLNRAQYYLGRKEKEQSEQAYQSAMKLPADSLRWEVGREIGCEIAALARRELIAIILLHLVVDDDHALSHAPLGP